MSSKAKLPHFRELDGVRGLAALAVFVHHVTKAAADHPSERTPAALRVIIHLVSHGALGVDVFFVLSGFLITSLLLVNRTDENYFHNFYWKRALRILPVYLVHLFLTELIIGDSWGYILLGLLFLTNFANRFHVNANGVGWSLAIEEQFYLLWPLCVRRLQIRWLYYLALVIVIGSVALRTVGGVLHGGVAIAYTFYRCDGLGLGAILALQWYSNEGKIGVVSHVTRVLNSQWLLAAATLTLVWLVIFADGGALGLTKITCVNYLAYRLIRRIAFATRSEKATSWLASGPMVFMGSISYGFYMYHGFVMILFDRWLGNAEPAHIATWVVRLSVELAVTIAVCVVSLRWMEKPIQDLRRFVVRRPKREEPAGADGSQRSA